MDQVHPGECEKVSQPIGERIITEARTWLGTPYIWGGQSRDGVDCSGFVQCVLASLSLDPRGDQTAQALYDSFSARDDMRLGVRSPGALAFFGRGIRHITHVAFVIDATYMIEAGGGDRLTRTRADSEKIGACVRVARIDHRKDLLAVVAWGDV